MLWGAGGPRKGSLMAWTLDDSVALMCTLHGWPRPAYLVAEDCLYWWQLPFAGLFLDPSWV